MTTRRPVTICLVTDRRRLSPGARTTHEELVALEAALDEAIGAGIDLIQIRERDLDAAPLAAFVRHVMARARGTSTRVVVNDRADVALAAGADGVHLRSDGPPVDRVRAIGPRGWIVGRSIHGEAEVPAHAAADYLLFGTVFASASKGESAPWQGLEGLRHAASRSKAPMLAIGGITAQNAASCLVAGAAGIAAIGAFLGSGAVADRVAAMRRAFAAHFDNLLQ